MNTRLALGTFVILLLTTLISGYTVVVNAQSAISINSEGIIKLQSDVKETTDDIEEIDKRLVTIETHYVHISQVLDRIEEKIGD